MPVTVANDANGALNDVLVAAFGPNLAPFLGQGSIPGLGAGLTDSTSLSVALDTTSAGNFGGNLALDLLSRNPDMADLDLGQALIAVSATINDIANPAFVQTGGDGTLGGGGLSFLLDFGTVLLGDGSVLVADLAVLNDVLTPADFLDGIFDTSGAGIFAALGFGPIDDLAPGDSFGGLSVTFDTSVLGIGDYSGMILFNGTSVFPGLSDLPLSQVSLLIQGRVAAEVAEVPEPGTLWLLFLGLTIIMITVRRKTARR
jgi:hypothetical protein